MKNIISSIVLVGSILLAGCIKTDSGSLVSDVAAGVKLSACILEHSTEPVSQIVQDCAGASADLVTTVLAAHRSAMAKEASKRATYQDAGK